MLHPYNDEEHFDKVAEIYCGGYEWDIACVWREKESGKLFADSMGGCSCYGPWEQDLHAYYCPDYNGLADLTEVKQLSDATRLAEHLRGEDGGPTTEQMLDFSRSVWEALADRDD